MKKIFYELGTEEVFLTTGIYMTTANTSVNATCSNGEPYCTLTVNLDALKDPALAYLNVNLFGIDVEEFFVKNGLAVKLEGKEQRSGYVVYPLYRLNLKKIQGEVHSADAEADIAGIEAINRYINSPK